MIKDQAEQKAKFSPLHGVLEPDPLVQWSAALPPAQVTLVCYQRLAHIASVAYHVNKHMGMASQEGDRIRNKLSADELSLESYIE